MKIRVSKKGPPEISQASTADIAFLLLIFFISTTVFETEFGIPMVLPAIGGESRKVKSDNVMKIRASANGGYTVDDTPTPLGQIRDIIKTSLAENENLIISIETDADAAYERMIDVLDEVKAAKAQRFTIKKRRG
jgi:biopolymer transport protein ExbD